MPAEDNVAAIKATYEAFGTGDVEAILDSVADESTGWSMPSRSRPGMDSETERTASRDSSQTSAARRMCGTLPWRGSPPGDNEVFAFLRFAVRMKATVWEASFHLHHYFRFGDGGKVEYYRGSEDSAQVAKATAG